MVLTQKDYYDFQLKNNYFSRKLYTLIHENTICILGYSLNDSDINFIINEANNQKTKYFHNGDIFYITKNEINKKLIDFYKYFYDIEVLGENTFENFINKFNSSKTEASTLIEKFSDINAILTGKVIFDDEYLRLRTSFYDILKLINMNGLSLSTQHIFEIIISILHRKQEFCREYGAWNQYDHLSDWLIELLSIVDLYDIYNKTEISDIILFSLENCSSDNYWGYSWESYRNWDNKWNNIRHPNQVELKKIITENMDENSRDRIKGLLLHCT